MTLLRRLLNRLFGRRPFHDRVRVKQNVHIVLRGPDGRIKAERRLQNTVTAVGKTHIADRLSAAPDEAAMGWMAIGTGAPGVAQLGAEVDRNALTSCTNAGAITTYVADWAAGDGTAVITEAGVFNNVGAGLGTMLVSANFAAINKLAADTLQISWALTIA
jgi:hypothetical protein